MSLVSTNPILADSVLTSAMRQVDSSSRVCTVSGIINKTAGCVLLAAFSGAIAIPTVKAFPSALWIAFFVSLAVSIASIFLVRRSPRMAASITVLYSVAQGFMLGALGMLLQGILDAQKISVPGGVALQAFVIVVALMLAMLTLFRLGVLKGGAMFQSVLSVVTLGIFFTFLIAMVMGMFGASVSFLALPTEPGGGTTAMIGLGINAVVLIVAALWLIIDFRQVQDAVTAGAPASAEWYLTFGLIVTLAWIYLEALKLVFRIAMMFGNRK
ncbi:MAG: Bax inhibitor-1/YccA family protein [Phycisphaerales bacterium]|nr:Bax inhibitor-1/YccA family protein [Phycisphaerales bacterium]